MHTLARKIVSSEGYFPRKQYFEMLFHRKRWLGKNPNRPHIFRRSFTLVHDDLHCYSKRICTLCVKIDFLNSLLTSISLRSKPTYEKLNSYPPKICSLLDYT